jgi:hypothetical protein
MNAVILLRNRVGAVNAALHDLVAKVDGVDLVEPVVPGTSPLGLTLWHIPRTQDWLVHTTIRAVPEVADSFSPKGLPDPNEYGFGTGLSPERARAAAGEVRPETLLAYADAVTTAIDGWMETLDESDLDYVPDLIRRQNTRPAYSTPEALPDVAHLEGLPSGVLLLRPAISHVFMHAGEVEVLAHTAKSR